MSDTGSCSLLQSFKCEREHRESHWAEAGGAKCRALHCPMTPRVTNFLSFIPCPVFCFIKLEIAPCRRLHCPLLPAVPLGRAPGGAMGLVVGWDGSVTRAWLGGDNREPRLGGMQQRMWLRIQHLLPGRAPGHRRHLLWREGSTLSATSAKFLRKDQGSIINGASSGCLCLR